MKTTIDGTITLELSPDDVAVVIHSLEHLSKSYADIAYLDEYAKEAGKMAHKLRGGMGLRV